MMSTYKKVTVAKIMPKDTIITYIGEDKYLGTGYFLLREDLCKADYRKRVEKLLFREIEKDTFKFLKIADYSLREKETFDYDDKVIVLKDDEFTTYLNKNYYQYFKQQNLEFRFSPGISPVGLFKNGEWVGVVIPIKIYQDEVVKCQE